MKVETQKIIDLTYKDKKIGAHRLDLVVEQKVVIGAGRGGTIVVDGDDRDVLFKQIVDMIVPLEHASASLLQRKFKIGYARAARILDQLETAGYVGPAEGSKPREVRKRPMQPTEE